MTKRVKYLHRVFLRGGFCFSDLVRSSRRIAGHFQGFCKTFRIARAGPRDSSASCSNDARGVRARRKTLSRGARPAGESVQKTYAKACLQVVDSARPVLCLNGRSRNERFSNAKAKNLSSAFIIYLTSKYRFEILPTKDMIRLEQLNWLSVELLSV
jgi:hypothetical protein